MRIIGLTGGIATGKSTVSNLLRQHQFPIIDADEIAKEVVEVGTPGYRRIVKAFGTDILDPETGGIDRPKLKAKIFGDDAARHKLNNATHPYIRLEMLRQLLHAFLMLNSTVILDTPLLFEARMASWVHLIVVVYVPQEVQKARLVARDLITSTVAQERMDSQLAIEKKKEMAQIVIDNTGTKQETRDNVESVVARLVPPRWRVVVTWVVLFWPAAVCYAGLSLFKVLGL
ncbi:hypothetical protein HDU98_000485 [Podochytrium sp. JEL0797]|nr:hypothetical protein HDU98_000485 [Podochytrium sp. JEL0797]